MIGECVRERDIESVSERERENARQSEAVDVKVGHKFVIDASSSDNYEFAFNSKKNNKQTDSEADRVPERERERGGWTRKHWRNLATLT